MIMQQAAKRVLVPWYEISKYLYWARSRERHWSSNVELAAVLADLDAQEICGAQADRHTKAHTILVSGVNGVF